MNVVEMEAKGVSVMLDLSVGHLAGFAVEDGGTTLRPLHRAPWVDQGGTVFPEGTPANVRRLSGDFFCAPFGRGDVEEAPPHGWPANSRWERVEDRRIAGGRQARFRLARAVLGATIDKVLTLRDGHPFVYQEHVLSGGSGALPVAHHTMLRMARGGTLAFSAKRAALTPADPLETDPARGRSILLYPARSEDLAAFPLASGSTADLTRYPPGERHEDFVQLVEAAGSTLGYTACLRAAEGDLTLVLKDPRQLPVTMLWYSNGGRDYPPWNGRHDGVLGIEDGCSAVGHRQSLGDNPVRREGVATALVLDPAGAVRVRQVIGAALPPAAARRVVAVEAGDGALAVSFDDGPRRRLPFDDGFLARC